MAIGAIRPENDLAKQSLTEIFNDSVARYREAFPEKLSNLFITRGNERVYVAPEIARLVTKKARAVKKMIARRQKDMEHSNAIGMAGEDFIKTFMKYHTFNYISLTPESAGFVSARYPAAMNQIAVFDHEAGHLIGEKGWVVTRNGWQEYHPKTPHEDECIADAYAVLRHLQRFGGATDIFETRTHGRAGAIIIYSDTLHYSSAVVQKIGNIQKENPSFIQSLSLQETKQLAERIAIDYAFAGQTLDNIKAAYAPVRKYYNGGLTNWTTLIKTTARVMLENKDNDDVYRAGKLFLNRIDIKNYIAYDMRVDAEFQKDLALMTQHEKAAGFILNAADAMDSKRNREKPARPASAPQTMKPGI
jgi:hypothetical protein